MKIAVVMSYFQPKLGYQEYYLVKEQLKMGHEVRVFTSDRYQYSKSFSQIFGSVLKGRVVGEGEFIEEGVKVVRLPCAFEFQDQIFVKNLRSALVGFNPDIICIHDEISYCALISLTQKILLKRPLVADVHADYINMSSNFIRRLVFHILSKNPIYRQLYKKSDAFIAITEDSKKWLANEFGIENNRITIVPLAAETENFYPDPTKRNQIREKYEFDTSVVIIYAGKLIPGKDIELLLQAALLLNKKGLDIKVLIVGSGPTDYESKLYALVKEQKIEKIVFFKRFVDKKHLPSLYNAADIGVWPGDPSITIIEAMAVGLPIVLPFLGSTSHLFGYDVGFHFKRGNITELATCLELLVSDKNLRRKKGLEGHRMVTDRLNWQSVNAKTVSIYEDVITSNFQSSKRKQLTPYKK
jgi:glycosyltransferase involved in cell wall biosynthesis